ncbi:MAG: flavodoxin family protein [candidate division KSB1 bacterium]|nr:flavodoxin family protein [candidate division KSB1 bacterium]
MNILIVYDSVFGNTEKVARAVGSAFGTGHTVKWARPAELDAFKVAADLLIVGSPTRKFQPTADIQTFLKQLERRSLNGIGVAAFDTRISVEDTNSWLLRFFVKLFGYAAEPMLRTLQQKGGTVKGDPAGFIVNATKGPIKQGELERAEAWAKQLV